MKIKGNYKISDNGLNMPLEWFEDYGLVAGDEVAVFETEQGMLVLPRLATIRALLDEIGTSLKAKGVTLEELMETGREIRGDLLKEQYGIDVDE